MAKSISELNDLYTDAETCDKDLFSEMRSNILLIAGDHYAKKAQVDNIIRSRSDINEQQKVRLTQNHIQKIFKIYVNNIISAAPNVRVTPNTENDLKDKKSAQLRQSVWEHGKKRYRLRERVREWCKDYTGVGEVATKIFWDPNIGDFLGHEEVLDDEGQPTGEKTPAFTGDFVFETLYGFNLLRDRNAQHMRSSPWLITRKMVDTKPLKARYKDDAEKLKFVTEEQNSTFIVFDGQSGSYSRSKNQTLLREMYIRPCMEYPQGYYYVFTQSGILEEGELPFGVFPIVWGGFEQIQTSPRARSPVKHMRPFQAEINRSFSKMAEHQITLGDDKIVVKNGTKLEHGGILPGIRGVKVTGENPTILPGRDGSQYLSYAQAKISELYSVMMVEESMVEKLSGDLDVYALLLRSASQKKMFSEYIQGFEQFLTDVCETFLKLAQHYYPDQMLIPMVGVSEYVNLDEFRNLEPMGYQITLENTSEDIETRLGKQLVLNQAIQYGGQNLTREDFGRLLQSMPFADQDSTFESMTLDDDLADNAILALDRGTPPQVHSEDNHALMIKRLTIRMRKPDFALLPPNIQHNYDQAVKQHEFFEAQRQAKAMAAKNEYIPIDGGLIACDLYVPDPKNALSSKRARFPQAALMWLDKQLELQGTAVDRLEQMGPVHGPNVAMQAAQMNQQQHQASPQGPGAPVSPQPVSPWANPALR
jgi:hypothetical protein